MNPKQNGKQYNGTTCFIMADLFTLRTNLVQIHFGIVQKCELMLLATNTSELPGLLCVGQWAYMRMGKLMNVKFMTFL